MDVAVVGATGYTGREALALLARHPELRVAHAMTARKDHVPEPPAPGEPPVAPLDLAKLGDVDGVLLCAPHGAAAALAAELVPTGVVVVDLSADFRLRDAELYAQTYGTPHPAPSLLHEAVYGLTEHARDRLPGARLIANPGCYPTATLLPLLPLLRQGLLDDDAPIVADCKSGISGAGKAATERTHYGFVHENCSAYGIGTHRHLPEIRQEAGTDRIVFVPHLLPAFRGMLATLYLTPAAGTRTEHVHACLAETYADEPFVAVLPAGLPDLHTVNHTNRCAIGVADAGGAIVVVSTIDNLVKGAAGQAIQNLNVALGLPETAGLT